MKSLKVAGLLVVVMVLGGCAALFHSKSTPVAMQTNPSAAEIWIGGARMGVTPMTLDLSNKKSLTVTFKREGFQDASYIINNHVGGGWIVLDILGGLLPVIIDAATGSWYSLNDRTVNINLAPVAPAAGTSH